MPVDLDELERMFNEERMKRGGLPQGSPSPSPAVAYDHSAAPPNPATSRAPAPTAEPYQNYEAMFEAERATRNQRNKNSLTQSNLSQMPEVHLYDTIDPVEARRKISAVPMDDMAESSLGPFANRKGDFANDGWVNAIDRLLGLPKGSIGQPTRWINEGISKLFNGTPEFKKDATFDDWKSGNIYQEGTDVGQRMRDTNPLPSTGNATVDKVGGVIGDFVAPMVGTYGTGIGKLPEMFDARYGQLFGKGIMGQIGRGAANGAVTGAPMNIANQLTEGDRTSFSDLAKAGEDGVLYGAGLGAAGGAVLGGITKGANTMAFRGAINDFINSNKAGTSARGTSEIPDDFLSYRRSFKGQQGVDFTARNAARDTRINAMDLEAQAKAKAQADELARSSQEAQQAPQSAQAPQSTPTYDMSPELQRPTLPSTLRGAAPKYNAGQSSFNVQFESDVDKALYIVAKSANLSKSDEKYMDFLRERLGGSDQEIRGHGMELRSKIKEYATVAKQNGQDTFTIRDSNKWRPKTGETPAPQAAPPQAAPQGWANKEMGYGGSATPQPVSNPVEAPNAGSPRGDFTPDQYQAYKEVMNKYGDNSDGPRASLSPEDLKAYEQSFRGLTKEKDGANYTKAYEEMTKGRDEIGAGPLEGVDPELRAAVLREINAGRNEATAGNELPPQWQKKQDDFFENMLNDGIEKAKNPKPKISEVEREAIERELRGGRDQQTATSEGGPPKQARRGMDSVRNEARRQFEEDANKAYEDLMTKDRDGSTSNMPLTDAQAAQGPNLISYYTAKGDYAKVADIVERLVTGFSASGRALNMAKIYSRMDDAGALKFAQRLKNRTNKNNDKLSVEQTEAILKEVEQVKKSKVGLDQGKLLNEIVYRTDDERAALDPEFDRGPEISQLEHMLDGVNQEQRSLKAAANKLKPRKRDTLLEQYKAEADVARAELKKQRGENNNTLSANPVGQWAKTFKTYAPIVRYHIANGAVKFSDFGKAMAREGVTDETLRKKLYVEGMTRENRKRGQKLQDYEKALNAAIRGARMSEDDALNLRVFAKEITGYAKKDRDAAMSALQQQFNRLHNPTALERMSALQTIGMLLNPITLAKNAASGPAMLAAEAVSKAIALPIDFTRSVITKTDRQILWRTHKSGDWWANFVKGGKAGWDGYSPDGFDTQYELSGLKFNAQSKNIVMKSVGYMEKTLFASMKSFDYANAMYAVNKAMGESATKLGRQMIKDGKLSKNQLHEWVKDYVEHQGDELMEIHQQYGKYVTFQDDNPMSQLAVKTKRGLNSMNKLVGLDTGWGLGDVALKFAKTPANLMMRTIDYSPIGGVKAMYQLGSVLAKGGKYTSRDVQMSIGRAVSGSVLGTFLGYKMAELGIISGGASADRKVEGADNMSGFPAYSVNLSALGRYVTSALDAKKATPQKDDVIVNYEWFQPFSTTISLGATYKENGGGNPFKKGGITKALNAADAVAGSAADQSFAQGIMELTDQTPNQGPLDKAADVVASVPSSFIPSSVKQVRRIVDNEKREVTYSGGTEKFGQAVKEQVQNAIPQWSKGLEVRRDNLGGKLNYYEDKGNKLANVAKTFSPSAVTKYNPSPTMEKLNNLYKESGNHDALPTTPDRDYTIKGVTHKFDQEQFDRYRDLIAEYTPSGVNRLSGSGSADNRVKKAAEALRSARDKAREKVIKEYKLK